MPKRKVTPLTDEQRLALLRELSHVAEHARSVVLASAQAFLQTGSDPDDVAHALGVSRSALYRRLANWRQELEHADDVTEGPAAVP